MAALSIGFSLDSSFAFDDVRPFTMNPGSTNSIVQLVADDLAGFPDAATKADADRLRISRYGAYRLLADENAIRPYCNYDKEVWQITQAQEAELEAAGALGDRGAIETKYESEYDAAADRFRERSGLIGDEIYWVPVQGEWSLYCAAFQKGWDVATPRTTKNATPENRKLAEQSLLGAHIELLNTRALRNLAGFNAVECRSEAIEQSQFVGCRFVAPGGRSHWAVYLIGRTDDGRLTVSPRNGKAMLYMRANLEANASRGTFVEGLGQGRLDPAEYIGAAVDVAAVVTRLE